MYHTYRWYGKVCSVPWNTVQRARAEYTNGIAEDNTWHARSTPGMYYCVVLWYLVYLAVVPVVCSNLGM